MDRDVILQLKGVQACGHYIMYASVSLTPLLSCGFSCKSCIFVPLCIAILMAWFLVSF